MLLSTGNYLLLVRTGAGRPITLLDLASFSHVGVLKGVVFLPSQFRGREEKKARRVCHMVLFRHTEVQSNPFCTDTEGAIKSVYTN